ncbi:MAG: deoxyribodipyrimidine photo-lyase [Terrimicrobiaceae bacterium]
MTTNIHWFRRDFRITDNPSLHAAALQADRVVCVYILSSWSGSHRWTGPKRQEFLCGALASLAANLEAIGGRLVIREGDPVHVLLGLAAECGASAIHFNRDPDPFGRAVEQRLADRAGRVVLVAHKGHAIHERDEVLTGSGEPFRVFTPYSRAWAKLPKPAPLPKPRALNSPTSLPSLPLPGPEHWGLKSEGGVLAAGERAARQRLTNFLNGPLQSYGDVRDIPSLPGTSRLSQDLRFGLVSAREVYSRVRQRANELDAIGRRHAEKFLSEIIWREFYFSILWHWPEVLDQEFDPKFRGMHWPGNLAGFDAWSRAETGYPIVDAAMRELLTTGFMHNRTRMITAMFLTKDLLVDWRVGESFFLQKLVDGEIASNNGGWQWSAGTGADAAPYFRIQNPWTQTSRYDPDGTYIRKWLPELRDVPAPLLAVQPPPGTRLAHNYPPPMVDHAQARDRALEVFAAAKSSNS